MRRLCAKKNCFMRKQLFGTFSNWHQRLITSMTTEFYTGVYCLYTCICVDARCLDNKQYFDQFKTTSMHVTYPCRMTNTGCGTGWSTKPGCHDPQSSLIKLVIDVGGCWDLIWFHLPARGLIPFQGTFQVRISVLAVVAFSNTCEL